MITVYQVLTAYCKENNLPGPSVHDLKGSGAMIKHHFVRFWAPKQPANELGQLPDAGWIKSLENGKELIVVGYPDAFREDMIIRIKMFYSEKGKDNSPDQTEKKRERKRIKPGLTKAYSVKRNGGK